jgi:hypothetical protein
MPVYLSFLPPGLTWYHQFRQIWLRSQFERHHHTASRARLIR